MQRDDVKSPCGDLLRGVQSIGEFLGLPLRTTRQLVDTGCLPVFKLGGIYTARKSTINAYLAELEAIQLNRVQESK